MDDVLGTIRDALGNGFQMAWEVWWALILGFLLSGIVQAWVTRGQMERVLGGRRLAATLRGTGLGAASSSCSYAAIAIAKSAFQKGAGLPAALACMSLRRTSSSSPGSCSGSSSARSSRRPSSWAASC